jgi:predicted MFS family arabinose efflux permease
LSLPAVLVAILVFATGLHRLAGHMNTSQSDGGSLPFGLVFLLCICIAVNMGLLVRFTPILLVRRFPGGGGQGWGGAAVFATGVFGALGAFAWGHLSERRRRGLFMAGAQVVAAPFLYLLMHTPSPALAPVWGVGLGLTMGSVFPLSVVLARQSKAGGQRLGMGLAIGGAWGLGEVAFILGGRYVDRFPAGASEPVLDVMALCWALLAATAVLAVLVARRERPAPIRP